MAEALTVLNSNCLIMGKSSILAVMAVLRVLYCLIPLTSSNIIASLYGCQFTRRLRLSLTQVFPFCPCSSDASWLRIDTTDWGSQKMSMLATHQNVIAFQEGDGPPQRTVTIECVCRVCVFASTEASTASSPNRRRVGRPPPGRKRKERRCVVLMHPSALTVMDNFP
ncbi:hypothetical protein C8R45DRAFT_977632 [Mycena sanguinolenta]|nr:hypothetical protein C8R45DRAFT_977632 [Mycena sanguinolenta]